MNVSHTDRGFDRIDFIDAYSEPCSLQASSVIFDNPHGPGSSAVWLGHGDRRMHLSRQMVAELVAHLSAWLATGSLVPPSAADAPPHVDLAPATRGPHP